MANLKRSVTVAIDFGTTYSGFGFAEANVLGESGIQVFRGWGRGQGFSFYKTPTCVLLSPDGNFSKFGHAAVEAYAKHLAKGDNKDFIYFERFKLVLYNTKVSGLFMPFMSKSLPPFCLSFRSIFLNPIFTLFNVVKFLLLKLFLIYVSLLSRKSRQDILPQKIFT